MGAGEPERTGLGGVLPQGGRSGTGEPEGDQAESHCGRAGCVPSLRATPLCSVSQGPGSSFPRGGGGLPGVPLRSFLAASQPCGWLMLSRLVLLEVAGGGCKIGSARYSGCNQDSRAPVGGSLSEEVVKRAEC